MLRAAMFFVFALLVAVLAPTVLKFLAENMGGVSVMEARMANPNSESGEGKIAGALGLYDLAALLGIVGACVTAILFYLRPDPPARKEREATQNLTEIVQSLSEQVERLSQSRNVLGEKEQELLVQTIKDELTETAQKRIIDEIRVQASFEAVQRMEKNAAAEICKNSAQRLFAEAVALRKRANINLGLGLGVAVTGLGFLFLTLPSGFEAYSSPAGFLQNAPRFALVLVTELLAFFFLRLYKLTLAEVKYFQNEITNVEQRSAALAAAVVSNDGALVSKVVSDLSITERNRVLEKGQTTVELAALRLEKEGMEKALRYMTRAHFWRDRT